MMLYPAMNELLKQVPSRYELVNVVAARARKIAAEAEADEISLDDKPVSIAVREIAAGNVPRMIREETFEEETASDSERCLPAEFAINSSEISEEA